MGRGAKEERKEVYNPNTSINKIKFELDMTFTGVEQCRGAIVNYAIEYGKGIYFKVDEKNKITSQVCQRLSIGVMGQLYAKRECISD